MYYVTSQMSILHIRSLSLIFFSTHFEAVIRSEILNRNYDEFTYTFYLNIILEIRDLFCETLNLASVQRDTQ